MLCCVMQVRGRDSLPAVPGASGHGNHSRGSREEEEAEERRAKQQSQRRLLGTMALPPYTHAPHTSFIKLEGVDSVGNVRGLGDRGYGSMGLGGTGQWG